jgi:hypothetical protein
MVGWHDIPVNTQRRPISERVLCVLLRYLGSVSLLAMVAVFIPYSWMDATHRWLGMGKLPSDPIVGYLARSLSLFYALLGALLWLCSFDLHRHRAVLCYLAAAFIFFGAVLWGIDYAEGMPAYWKHAEGPMVMVMGAILFTLSVRLKPHDNSRTG